MRNIVCSIISQLHGIFVVMIFIPVIANIFTLFVPLEESYTFIYAGLTLLVPILATYFASVKCRGLSAYLLISIASIAVPLLVGPRLAERIILPFMGFVVMIIRLVARLREREDVLTQPAFGAVGFFIVAYVISCFSKYEPLADISYYMTFIYIILYMVYLNFSNLESYLEINKDLSNVPKRQINRTNNTLLIIFLVLTTLIMIFLPRAGIEKGLSSLGSVLLMVIRFLARREGPDTPIEDPTMPEDGGGGGGGGMPDFGMTETPLWLSIFYEVMTYVLFIVVGAFVLFMLVRFVMNLFKDFYRPITNEEGEVREFIKDEAKDDKTSIFTSIRSRRPLLFNFSPEATVRKAYIRRIEKQKKKIDSASYTPEEIEAYVALPETEENRRLHLLYEQARYSENGVTKEEAKSI